MAVKFVVKVTGLKGHCNAGHKIGDQFEVSKYVSSDLCGAAYHSIYPYIVSMEFGGMAPWQIEKDVIGALACPDGYNQLTMEIVRVTE